MVRITIEVFILLVIFSFTTYIFMMVLLKENFNSYPFRRKNVSALLRKSDEESSHRHLPLGQSSKNGRGKPLGQNLVSGTKKRLRDPHLGRLYGGPANCHLYETTKVLQGTEFNCFSLKFQPAVQVCTHPLKSDKYISFSLEHDGVWERHSLGIFREILLSDKELGVYDIGANIGMYTMVAAVLGHRVVAVEPHLPNLRQLHKALQLNTVESRVIVLQNALSNTRGTYELSVPKDNQGGVSLTSQDADKFCKLPEPCPPQSATIVLNDLLEVTNFQKAIIKIDIEGYEHKALRISKRFFKDVKITHILMEWQNLRKYYGSQQEESEDKNYVYEMIQMLIKRGFQAMDIFSNEVLSQNHWYGWPDDVLWVQLNHSKTL